MQAQAYSLNANWFFLEDVQGEYIASIGLSETPGETSAAILSYFCTAQNELLLNLTPQGFTLPESQAFRVAYAFDGSAEEDVAWLSTGATAAPFRGEVRTLTAKMLEAERFSVSLADASETDHALTFEVAGVEEGLNTLPCF